MTNKAQTPNSNGKVYDLEERTFTFAKRAQAYVQALPRGVANMENGKQLVRSAGSVGANYIEANESLSKKDFAMRIKICRKEAKESRYWVLLTSSNDANEQAALAQEAHELVKIFHAIAEKSS